MSVNRIDGVDVSAISSLYGPTTPAAAASAAVHVYVASTGSDSNPGTIASPKLTLAGAYALLPLYQFGAFVVHFASGTYAYSTPPINVQRGRGAFIVLVGDGAGQGADTGFTVSATGTVTAGSSLGALATTGLTADALIGVTLEMTSGAASGCRQHVQGNTATTISLATPLTNSAAAQVIAANGDTFKLQRPAVLFTSAASIALHEGHSLHLVNIAWSTVAARVVVPVSPWPQHWFGVEQPVSHTVQVNGLLYAGNPASDENARLTYAAVITALGLSVNALAWNGWGSSYPSTSYCRSLIPSAGGEFDGFYCGNGGLPTSVNEYARCTLRGGRSQGLVAAYGDFCIAADASTAYLMSMIVGDHALQLRGDARVAIEGPLSIIGTSVGILALGSSRVMANSTAPIVVTTSSASGVQLQDGASLLSASPLTVSSPGQPLYLLGTTVLRATTITCTSTVNGCSLENASRVSCTSLVSTGKAFVMADAATLHVGSMNVQATAPGAAAFTMVGACQLAFASITAAGTCTISNLSTAANSNGMNLSGGACAFFVANPTINTSGSSGYGVSCRGGGQAGFFSQPTNVVGPTTDFTVGTVAGDDFNDTSLSASLSSRVSGTGAAFRYA